MSDPYSGLGGFPGSGSGEQIVFQRKRRGGAGSGSDPDDPRAPRLGTGVFVVAGESMAVQQQLGVALGVGAYSLVGQAISVARASLLGTGAFVLAGQDIAATQGAAPSGVVFDATSGPHTPADGTTATWTHTLGAGASAVAIAIGGYDGAAGATITAATFGGVNILPGLVRAGDNTLIGDVIYILGLTNLVAQGLTGTQTVSITWSMSMALQLGTSISVTGSNNTTLFSNTATTGTAGQGGSSPTITVGSAAGELVFDFVMFGGAGNSTITGPQVAVAENMASAGGIRASASRSNGAAPNVTPSYSLDVSGWIAAAASFKA